MPRERCGVAVLILLLGLGLLVTPSGSSGAPVPSFSSAASGTVNLPNLTRQGLVLPMGNGSAPDGLQVGHPSVLVGEGGYEMWYFEVATSWYCQIAYATSSDGRTWTKHGVVLWPTVPEEGHNTAYPSVVRVNGTYWMFYDGTPQIDGSDYQIFAATSPDGLQWTKLGVVLGLGPPGSPDAVSLVYPHVLYVHDTFYLWYTGLSSTSPPDNGAIMLAESANGTDWTKLGVVLSHGEAGSLDGYNAVAGSVAFDGSAFVMVYDGESAYFTSHLLYAVSADGVHWTKAGLALDRDPPQETYLAQPDLVLLPGGRWDVYYAVRNGTSDLQIYLATGASAPSPRTGPGDPLVAFRSGVVDLVPPLALVAVITALGAVAGGGLGYLHERLRRRGTR